jgi:hypothetical protein
MHVRLLMLSQRLSLFALFLSLQKFHSFPLRQ